MRLTAVFISLFLLSSVSYSQNTTRNYMAGSGRFAYGLGLQYDLNSVYLGRPLVSVDIEQSVNTPLFFHSSDFSTSLTSHISALYHFNFKDFESSFPYVSAPFFLELNIGHIATKNFFSDRGFVIGGGYGLLLKGADFDHGGAFTAGFRFWLLKKNSLTTRYILLSGQKNTIHTLSVMINIGKYLGKVKGLNKVSKFTGGA